MIRKAILVAVMTAGMSSVATAQSDDRPPANWQMAKPMDPANGGANQREFKPAVQPPAYPVAKITPIDPALRAQAKKILMDAMASDRSSIRTNALEAMERSLSADECRPFVVKGLSDSSTGVRFTSCILAGNLKFTDLRPMLYRLAYDNSPNVRLAARYGLHKLGDSTLTQELVNPGLLDERKEVRANAVMLLGMLGEPSAVRPLKQLKERNGVVQVQVVDALWRLGDRTVLDDLVAGTISRDPGTAILAILALGSQKTPEVADHIRGVMISEYAEVALASARALGMLGADDGYGVASKYAKSIDPRQRGMAALAFGAIGRSDSQLRLKALMEDKELDVQLAAATAMLKLKPNR